MLTSTLLSAGIAFRSHARPLVHPKAAQTAVVFPPASGRIEHCLPIIWHTLNTGLSCSGRLMLDFQPCMQKARIHTVQWQACHCGGACCNARRVTFVRAVHSSIAACASREPFLCRQPHRKSSRLAQENSQPNRRQSLEALSQPSNTTEAHVEQRRKSLQALTLR